MLWSYGDISVVSRLIQPTIDIKISGQMVYPPQKIPKIDKLLFNSELIGDLSIPFIIEVMGMPQSGKTSLIHSFLKKTSDLY